MKTLSQIKKILKSLKPELKEKYSVKEIGIFGSVVRNEQKKGSDIDIAVVFYEVPGLFKFINLEAFLEKKLRELGVRVFKDIHVSGHAGREDLRDFISMIKPENLIPAHGDLSKLSSLGELAREMGYTIGKTCHISQDSNVISL